MTDEAETSFVDASFATELSPRDNLQGKPSKHSSTKCFRPTKRAYVINFRLNSSKLVHNALHKFPNFFVVVATVDLETMEADQSSDETEQDNIDTTAARVARGERGGGEGVEMVETVRLLSESSSQSHEEKRVKPIHALFVQLMVTVRYDGVMLKSIHVTQLPTCFGKCSTPRPLPEK